VAITRARNTLIILDSSSDIRDLSLLHGFLYRTAQKDVLSEIWQRVSAPDEWEKQGDYFFEREYDAAAECYKNAGNLQRSGVVIALTPEKEISRQQPNFSKDTGSAGRLRHVMKMRSRLKGRFAAPAK
jgi:hypothetical protein